MTKAYITYQQGLLNWVKYDHDRTTDPLELAASALFYLLEENASSETTILAGILAFLRNEGFAVVEAKLHNLKKLIEANDFDDAEISDWFNSSFRRL